MGFLGRVLVGFGSGWVSGCHVCVVGELVKAAWYARAAVRSRECVWVGGCGSVSWASPVRSRWSWAWVNSSALCRPVAGDEVAARRRS